MKKIFISLACAVICCACDARHNKSVTNEQKDVQTEAVSEANNDQEGIAEGQMAPDFTLKDIDGKSLSLSSLRGKYVIIDFWGTWCIWCVRGMPKMKEYYNKYSDKMEILGVDCNDPEKKWKDAVKELDARLTAVADQVKSVVDRTNKLEAQVKAQQEVIDILQKQNADLEKRLTKLEKKNKKVSE